MRISTLCFALTTLAACGPAPEAGDLDIPRLFAAPDLNGPSPKGVKISPDSSRVTFLRGKVSDPLQMDLWEYDLAAKQVRLLVDSKELVPGEETLSEEELARRERLRIEAQRGIVSYQFSPDGESLLFPLNGDLYLYDLDSRSSRRLTDTPSGETDPKFSATGRYVSFVRNQNLFAIDLRSLEEKQLTHDDEATIKNGMAEFVAQEEMDRYTGYWWAPDDSAIAFLRVDESNVQVARRFEINADGVDIYEQRYPATGTPNAILQLGVIAPDGTDLRWINTGDDQDIYLPRIDWFPDSVSLAVQRQSRDQQTLELLKVNTETGMSQVLLTETSETWINLHNSLKFLESSPHFIWKSERSGHAHLYLYTNDGELVRPVTSGEWDVVVSGRARSALLHVDENSQRIYFSATLDSPLERHVYSTSYEREETPVRISRVHGTHKANFANNGAFYVDTFSNIDTPPQVRLHSRDGSHMAFIEENRLDDDHPYAAYLETRPTIEFGVLEAESGDALHYKMMKPANLDRGKRYPAVVFVYGGPHGQRVTDEWLADFNEILARSGFIVFTLDNRGTSYRGTDFDAPIYRHMGGVEVTDQMVGVEFLRSLDFVDASKIGVWGWSYGGYMTLMCMFKEPEAFAVGVAGAPVTDLELYDTHYTERYMSTPVDNPDGYESSSVFPYAKNLESPLLVIHGMADDNVLFTNSTKLFSTLQRQGIPFDMMTYPGSKHGLTRVPATGKHVYAHILRYLKQHLQD